MQQPQYIDHFRIHSALDSGAQGAVFLGVDEKQARKVAIKTLRKTDPAADYEQALTREVDPLTKLQHPNIVPLYDYGFWQGSGYLVYEHVADHSLQTRTGDRPLPAEEVLQIAGDVLQALAHGHEKGLVHAGLEPARIVQQAGGTRVTDFGITRLPGALNSLAGEAGRYLAPEVVAGDEPTAASDLYALGLVMFELLTGTVPMSGDESIVTPPSTLREGITPETDTIVLRALASAPGERFASATDMATAVRVCLQHLQPGVKPGRGTPTFKQLLRKLQRNKDFPAFASHISEINRLTSSDSNATIVDLANTVLKDLSLTNKLLRLVNSSMYCQFGGKITTVSRAITIIGFENIRTLAVGLLLFDQVRKHPNARELVELNLWSFMSAGVARGLAADTPGVDAEQAFIAALMARFGKLLAIYYLPEEYAQIGRLVEEGTDQNTASVQVLGLNLHTLGRMVAEHLHFPRLLVDAMQAPAEEPERRPQDAMQATLQIAGFSAQVGDIVQQPDAGRDAGLSELTERFDEAITIEDGQLCALIHENLREALELIEAPREWIDDIEAKLRSLQARPEADPPAEDDDEQPAATAPLATDCRDEILTGVNEITNMLIAGQALNDVLGAILEIAYRTLALQRVVMFVNDMRTRQVSARFGIGAVDATLLKKLRFSLSERNQLHAAVESGEDVLVEQALTVQDTLPDWCRKHARAATCALLPICLNDKLIGIIYADADTADGIDARQFQHLKTLRNQAALAVSAQRKR